MHSLVSLYFIIGMFEVGKKGRGGGGWGMRGKIRGGRGLQYPPVLQVVWPLVFEELWSY